MQRGTKSQTDGTLVSTPPGHRWMAICIDSLECSAVHELRRLKPPRRIKSPGRVLTRLQHGWRTIGRCSHTRRGFSSARPTASEDTPAYQRMALETSSLHHQNLRISLQDMYPSTEQQIPLRTKSVLNSSVKEVSTQSKSWFSGIPYSR